MTQTIMFFIGQSVVIVGAILVSYIRTAVKLAVLESNSTIIARDHGKLAERVHGMSRSLAMLEGSLKS